jgi:hypothetical protein
MKAALVLLLLLVGPVPAFAQALDRATIAAGIAGQVADQITTYRFLHNGSGCTEANRLMGPAPSTPRIVLQEAATTGSAIALQWLVRRAATRSSGKSATTMRWLSRAVGVTNGASGLKAAVHNVNACGW